MLQRWKRRQRLPSLRSKAKLTLHFKGGPGSGHRGHAGRPGKRGGSLPGKGGGTSVKTVGVDLLTRYAEYLKPRNIWEYPKLVKDIKEHGIKTPLTLTVNVDTKQALLTQGNHRLAAARELGMKTVPVELVISSTLSKDVNAHVKDIRGGDLDTLLSLYGVVEKEHTSAIIAFSLENDDYIRKLSEKYGPNRVQPLHMTLLYMGHAVDSVARDSISERLRAFSNVYAPVDGVYNGWASFDDTGDGYPHVLLYDSPPLPFFRQRLAEAMDDIRPEQDHGFTPHTTLSYLDYQDKPNGVVNYPKTFDSLWLFWGDEKHEFPLIGDVVEKQLPIGEEGKQALINLRIELFFDKSDALAERMYVGEISLGQWQEDMKSLIRNVHTSAAAIGRGGWDEMTWQDWGRLGTPMREQYRYLQGFAEAISEKRDVISLKAIQARARLYGEGAGGSAVLMQAGAEIEGLLPYIPRDGSTECLNHCHCRWLLSIADTLPDGRKVVQAVWMLGVAEHCNTCLSRDGHAEVIIVSVDTDVPRVIGGV